MRHGLPDLLAGKYATSYSLRVARLTFQVALLSGECPPEDAYLVKLLYDLGKTDLPREVLGKPMLLAPAEVALVRTHPARGAQRLIVAWPDSPPRSLSGRPATMNARTGSGTRRSWKGRSRH